MTTLVLSRFHGRSMIEIWREINPIVGAILGAIVPSLVTVWLMLRKERTTREKEAKKTAEALIEQENKRKRDLELQDQKRQREKEAEEEAAAAILKTWYDKWHQELRDEVHHWRDENQKLVGQVEVLRRDRRDMDAKLIEMERELNQKELDLKSSRARIAELEKQVEQLQRQNLDYRRDPSN
jgi:gas vesicle protein